MFDPTSLMIFVAAAVALLITPGPAVLYIIARSLEQGRLAGIISTLGIALASAVHVLFAALGLSALLCRAPSPFPLLSIWGLPILSTWVFGRCCQRQKQAKLIRLNRSHWDGYSPKASLSTC